MGYPVKGNPIKDQMAEFFVTNDGHPAMRFQWDRIFPKKEVFVFSKDTVAARIPTEDEMRTQARLGAFGMRSSTFAPLGFITGLAAGGFSALAQSADGKSAIIIVYNNPQGFAGFAMLIAETNVIAEICRSIPPEKMETK